MSLALTEYAGKTAESRAALERRRAFAVAEQALISIGRLEHALDSSPLEDVWHLRMQLDAASQLMECDGLKVDRDRLHVLMCGLPIERHRDNGVEARALRMVASLRRLARRTAARRLGTAPVATADDEIEPGIGAWDDSVDLCLVTMAEERATEGALIATALALRGWIMKGGAASAGMAALPAQLVLGGLAKRYLPCFVAAWRKAALVEGEREDEWLRRFLDGFAHAAEKGERTLGALQLARREWHRRLGSRRSTSRLPRLVDAMLALPVVAPAQAARVMGLTVGGATKLITELVALGILIETTRRKSWRRFLTADLAVAAQLAIDAASLPPPRPAKKADDDAPAFALPPDEMAATAVYEERAPAPAARREFGAGPVLAVEPLADIDLSQVYAELDRVTKRVRASIEGAAVKPQQGEVERNSRR